MASEALKQLITLHDGFAPGPTKTVTPKKPVIVQGVRPDGFGLAIEFRWIVDRFAHSIFRLQPDGTRLETLKSIEGTDLEVWPASPPIQTLSLQPMESYGEVALGVGMAGHSHWSLSAAVINDPPSLLFDVACRVQGAIGELGSAYFTDLPALEPMNRWQCRVDGLTLDCEKLDSNNETWIEPAARSNGVAVRVDTVSKLMSRRTVRWNYRMKLSDTAT